MSEQTIYVSHAAEDAAVIDRLKGELTAAGFSIARNTHTVPAGLRLKPALKDAMAGAARFLACFSSRYGAPPAYEADEVALAIEQSASRPAGETWLIPVRLTPCEIPPLPIGNGHLGEFAAVDLHTDWAAGMARLLASLPARPAAQEPAQSAVTAIATGGPQLDVRINEAIAKNQEITNSRGEHASSVPAGRMSVEIDRSVSDETLKLTNQDMKR